MENVFMIVGFSLAAYSVIANDAIQTLGTFLSANRDKKWWVLWLFGGGILATVLIYGYIVHGGDVAYGRLDKVLTPEKIDPSQYLIIPRDLEWWHIIPPFVLLLVTRIGIPVSTTFLILTVFSIQHLEGTTLEVFLQMTDPSTTFGKMLLKSLAGYALAITVGLIIYALISNSLEKKFQDKAITDQDRKLWTVLQWCSTGALWAVWLTQDLANIFVYLPRNENLTVMHLGLSLVILLGLLGYIFYSNGGEIQKIVTSKTNTSDIRSATIIDFVMAILLYFFKEVNDFPMSTTWVFLGLLAGREIAMNYVKVKRVDKNIIKLVASDFGKATIGLVVSIVLVLIIHAFH